MMPFENIDVSEAAQDYFSGSTLYTVGGIGTGYVLGGLLSEAVSSLLGLGGWAKVALEGGIKLGGLGVPLYALVRSTGGAMRVFGIGAAAGLALSVAGDIVQKATGYSLADVGGVMFESLFGGMSVQPPQGGKEESTRVVEIGPDQGTGTVQR